MTITYILAFICAAALIAILLAVLSIGRNCDKIIRICDEMERR